jgi:hypothetical protein
MKSGKATCCGLMEKRFLFKGILLAVIALIPLIVNAQDDGHVIKIPVIVHVLYTDTLPDNGMSDDVRNSDEGNSTSRLPREKIIAELNDLDRDFQLQNTDTSKVIPEFKKVIANPKIHFYLKEIKYVSVNLDDILAPWEENLTLLHQLSPVVNSDENLNVYISTLKFDFGGSEGVTPVLSETSNSAGFDVVNLNWQWVGLRYRLLTHEVGHWLGLQHPWEDQQSEDGIDDIPLTLTWTDKPCVHCPPFRGIDNTIRADTGFKTANYNNYMDYSGCRVMFSTKQVKRMRFLVKTRRNKLWNN